MARSDWKRTKSGYWRRSEDVMIARLKGFFCFRRRMLVVRRPGQVHVRFFFTDGAAMDYADTHYPMEKQ